MSTDLPMSDVAEVPSRCFTCFRPTRFCFCGSVPKIDNRTDVCILQHRREKFHPFNTARIVNQALTRCRLLSDHNHILAQQFQQVALSPNVGLLYPGQSARVLADLPVDQRPDQLVVIDGTWHQAKSLLRELPQLQTLPQYQLTPTEPGRYRIRREPNEQALSTIEATVSALQSIEPDTAGLDQLLEVFEQMVNDQIGRSGRTHWRRNRRRRPGSTNLPKSLRGDIRRIVVAYGEQEPGVDTRFKPSDVRLPVYWVAQRLGTGETFRCAIEPRIELGATVLAHMRLTSDDFNDAVSMESFENRWRSFIGQGDQVAVYHPSTARMLGRIDHALTPSIILKAIQMSAHQNRGTLDDFLTTEAITVHPAGRSRAFERLANAVALTRHLNAAGP